MRQWDPFAEMMSMRQMMERLFEETYVRPRRAPSRGPGAVVLPVDVFESRDTYTVKAPLPGARPEDVRISVTGTTLTIRAEVRDDEEVVPDRYLYQERVFGTFEREVELPGAVQTDKAEAKFERGVLVVSVPKAEGDRPKQITVRSD